MATSSPVVFKEKVTLAPTDLAGKAPTLPKTEESRLVSLDTFRGFIMFWIKA